jgi:hypothetical protein
MNQLQSKAMQMILPMLEGQLETIVEMAIDYKQSVPLEQGETHVAGVLHEQAGQIFFVVCAFADQTVTRKIRIFPIKSLIQTVISRGNDNTEIG